MPRAEDGAKFGDAKASIRNTLQELSTDEQKLFHRNMQRYSEDRILYEAWAKDNFVSSGRSQTTLLERTSVKVEEKEHET